MPDDDMVLVRRKDLDRALRWIPTDDAGGSVTPYAARLLAAVNGEATSVVPLATLRDWIEARQKIAACGCEASALRALTRRLDEFERTTNSRSTTQTT